MSDRAKRFSSQAIRAESQIRARRLFPSGAGEQGHFATAIKMAEML